MCMIGFLFPIESRKRTRKHQSKRPRHRRTESFRNEHRRQQETDGLKALSLFAEDALVWLGMLPGQNFIGSSAEGCRHHEQRDGGGGLKIDGPKLGAGTGLSEKQRHDLEDSSTHRTTMEPQFQIGVPDSMECRTKVLTGCACCCGGCSCSCASSGHALVDSCAIPELDDTGANLSPSS